MEWSGGICPTTNADWAEAYWIDGVGAHWSRAGRDNKFVIRWKGRKTYSVVYGFTKATAITTVDRIKTLEAAKAIYMVTM